MADTKISDLTAVTNVLTTDEFVLARSGVTNKITGDDLATAIGGTPTGTGAMEFIQEIVAPSGGSANFDFTSIPGTYRHLKLMFVGQSENAAVQNFWLRVNNDSATNYAYEFVNATGSSVAAASAGSQTALLIGNLNATSDTWPAYVTVDLLYYANSTWAKAVTSFEGTAFGGSWRWIQCASTWTGTAAITRLTLFGGASDLKEASSASLYGIL